MKRAALYVRVSTQEQRDHGMSVDSQIAALKQYCADNGYVIHDIYNDAGISARKSFRKRPELLRMMDECKKFDIVLFTKLDRFFRSVADYYEVQSVLDRNHVPWRAIWEDYETETSAGVFKVNIMLSIAQAEADRTSERIKAVNEYRRSNGEWTASAPTGYKVVNSSLVIDESVRSAVRAGFDAYLATNNVREMHDAILAKGLTIGQLTCYRMLSNPAYVGFTHNHHCEPYLTQEEWDYIQSRRNLGTKVRKTRPSKVYLFQGMIRCKTCGSTYRAQTRTMHTRAGNVNYHQYYQCTKGKEHTCSNRRTIAENKIERYLLSVIEPEMDKYISSVNAVSADDEINIDEIKARYERQIRRIGDRYELDEISREEYKEKVAELRAKIDALAPVQKREIKSLPDGWRELYDSLSKSSRKTFWLQTIHTITIDEDCVITLDF